MIETLIEKLPTASADREDLSDRDGAATDDTQDTFLAALPIVQLIIRRRRSALHHTETADLSQGIALRLWKWRERYLEKSRNMSGGEWGSFAARTAYNEISRHLSNSSRGVSIDGVADIEAVSVPSARSVEGETAAEVFSMIRTFWRLAGELSLRQRRALILHSQELVIYFLQSGVSDDDLAGILGFEREAWNDIRSRLPLTDIEIAAVIAEADGTGDRSPQARSIKKARHEARIRLGRHWK